MKKMVKFVKKNLTVSLIGTTFALILLIMTVFWINRKGTFSVEDENKLVLDCDKVFITGDTVECDVSLVVDNKTKIYSVNALYDFDEGITYESFGVNNEECTGEGCLEAIEINEDGFAIVNINGIEDNIYIGKLKVTMPDEVQANSNYRIGLKEIELSWDEDDDVSDTMLELDDAIVNVRAANNVATLDEISIEDGELKELPSTDSSVKKYETEVEKDVTQTSISYSLTDENASVSGTGILDNLDLHYGNNIYYIDVTSEDKSVIIRYEVSIYRGYEFSTEVYTYNEKENFIYTKDDSGEEIISNLEQLSDNLHYELKDDNKLAIVYGEDDEVLDMYIVNFETDYLIVDNKIREKDNITIGAFLESFESEFLEFVVVNELDEEVTDMSDTIKDTYKLKVYLDDILLDTFTIEKNYFKINDSLVVDNQNMIIKRLKLGTIYGEFKTNFDTSGEIKFISNIDDNEVDDDDIIKTGDIVRVSIDGDTFEYTLSVLGDVTGDGIINIQDVGILYRYFMGKRVLNDESIIAGDVINDGNVNIQDVGILYRYFMGRRSSLEVVNND